MSPDDHTNGDAGRSGTVEPLACPTCARRYPLTERFCSDCETPLVYVGRGEQDPITDPGMRAQRVRPEYASGELVKVAAVASRAEAELIVGILLDQGIPARIADELASVFPTSSRDILVPESAYEAARDLVADTAEHAVAPAQERPARAARLALGMLVGLAAGAALAWALSELAG